MDAIMLEKIEQLVETVESIAGKPIEELIAEHETAVAAGYREPTMQEIVDEAGWDCGTCAAKGSEFCDELTGALYNGCPIFKAAV